MMTGLETSYRRLDSTDEDEDSSPGEQGTLVHVADGNKTRWHHIEDLDSFFTRVYEYHQRHGFTCMALKEFFNLFQFAFVVTFATVVARCVNYDLLFANKGMNITDKITIPDALYLGHQCTVRIGQSVVLVIFLIIAASFWILQFLRLVRNIFLLKEMQDFYSTALRIKPAELGNVTWHEVQQRLMVVQVDQQMCIHKQELTELDVYNRILRFKNYMIAMVNKEVLPMRYNIPFFGEHVMFTRQLKYNMELILFYSPWSLFANNYHLKEEYKRRSNREELVRKLRNQFRWLAFINLCMIPVVFVWQFLYFFFNYADLVKREPGKLGMRRWSMYSRLYLRHFNELTHEFKARLNRGYEPSTRYLNSFNSPLLTIIAENIVFVAGSILAVTIILSIWDEDVLRVEHLLRLIAALTAIVVVFRNFIPDENAVSCPELLMKKVLSQIHYIPSSWHGRAHTDEVRRQFSQLFQYTAVFLLEEVLSAISTPILLWVMSQNAGRMIDFFRNFTVEIAGVGDVCSFAQMDVRKHGDPRWQVTEEKRPPSQPLSKTEGGKTELSLIHFKITNPNWKPPQPEDKFLNTLNSRAHREALALSHHRAVHNPLLASLGSIELPETSMLQRSMTSMMRSTAISHAPTEHQHQSLMHGSLPPESLTYEESMMTSSLPRQRQRPLEASRMQRKLRRRGGHGLEGSAEESGLGLITSIVAGQQGLPAEASSQTGRTTMSMSGGNVFSVGGNNLTEQAKAELVPLEMGISALYMHELYHNRLVSEDRTTKWESIAENDGNPESYHDNDRLTPPSKLYRAAEVQQYSSSNPKQPLLKSQNAAFYQNPGQTYLSFRNETVQTSRDQTRPLPEQQPFMGFDPNSSRDYSDARSWDRTESREAVQSINLGSDSDEDESAEISTSVNHNDPSTLTNLPSLGFLSSHDENQINNEYQPPQL